MVRETRHLWVGNLPDNIREDRIREHFKRYGRVQNVKLLGRTENVTVGVGSNSNSGICATVAFMDIKSASKAHNVEHVLDERTLTTEYYEPAAIPTVAGAPSAGSSPAGSGYSGSSSSVNSTPAPASVSRYHITGGEDGTGNTCPLAASAAAPAAWRGTNDSATEYCRRGNTPATYSRYQRNNSNVPYATPPSNVERTTPHHRWYAGGDRGTGATGGESTPSTPGGGTESGRRRRNSGSGSSRSESSSPEPSDTSRASTPANQPPMTHHNNHRTQNQHQHQWAAATASGRPLAICVRNLPTRSTDSSLKDGLYHEYKKHGKVVWVKVVGQNADRYAVVRFKKPSDVEKALEVSQDKLFFGCKISVAPHQSCDEDADSAKPYETDIDEYHPKATRTLFIGNLEKDVTQQQLREKFKHFGRIIEIDIKKGSGGGAGYAFCQYASISSVVEAIRAMDGEYVGGSRVKLGFGKPVATTCVWVDGLTEHTEKQVLGAVSRCGAATSVCVDRAAGAALVHFEQAAAAGSAVRELRRVAASVSATEPDHPRLCVDYASRECQEAFYEQLEKHGGSAALTGSERLTGDGPTRYLTPGRHEPIRYEGCGTRSRASSYGRGSSRTPRYTTVDPYDPTDYAADRRYRVYDELGTSPPTDDPAYEERLQSVVVSPHRVRKHRRDSSSEDKKHSKERHLRPSVRRSRSGSRGAGSERHGMRRKHRRRRDGSNSRAGTPLRDEPDAPVEPRRPPRERPPLPMSLPLPKFAVQLLRSAPPTPRPLPAPAPDSPPRPPSASSSSGGSAPHSPSLEERIRSLDEKYEKWSGSRALADTPDRTRLRHRLLEIDINEVKPSEVVRSLLAKRSVFDEDSERLESVVRPPSPNGSPRSHSSCSTPRSLRYHYPPPTHSQTTNLVLNSHGQCSIPTLLDGESDISDRPADPRLNRPERLIRIEKLGKFNESNYRMDSRPRPRTPSTDRSQPDSSGRISPGLSKEPCDEVKEDIERIFRRNSSCGIVSGDHKPTQDIDSKTNESELLNNLEYIHRIPLPDTENLQASRKYTESKQSSTFQSAKEVKEDKINEDKKNFSSYDSSAKDVLDMLLKRIEQYDSTEITVSTNDKQNDCVSEKTNSVLEHAEKVEGIFSSYSNSKSEIMCNSLINKDIKSTDILQSSTNTNLKEDSAAHNNTDAANITNVTEKVALEEETINILEAKVKDNSTTDVLHSIKQEKENRHFQKSFEKEKHHNSKIHLPSEKKREQEKYSEDRSKSDRDKLKDNKERQDKHKHEFDKSRNSKTEKNCDKPDKEKRIKDDLFLTKHVDKTDRQKSDKDLEKVPRERKEDRDTDKNNKNYEDKLQRYDHHKKDKGEKDKKKDSAEDFLFKCRKDERYKHDKSRKDLDSKREIKKEPEVTKSRKSSRDETAREITRKDSSDSSGSRVSHESPKVKDLDSCDSKEEVKYKTKEIDLFSKTDIDKDIYFKSLDYKLDSIKIKTEIKQEKESPEQHSKVRTDHNTLINLKYKAEVNEKQRHYSVDSPTVDTKRKERLNSCSSLPSNIGHKRRMSSQDSFDSFNDGKKYRNDIKITDKKDSKDFTKATENRHKTTKFSKGHFAKIIESKTKDDKKNQVKPPDELYAEHTNEPENRDSKNYDKFKIAKASCKESNDKALADAQQDGLHSDLDFLATLELRSSEEDERQKALRKEMKEKKRIQQLQQIQELQMQHDAFLKDDKKQKNEEKKKELAREKRMSTDRKSREDKNDNTKRKNKKLVQSSDTSDSDEPKKHSIFDIVDDGPTYISMYDKVKARSCKNMQKQEEEKRQEKIKAKFSQLKQSRAKREEKKRSSWDEDSDSEQDKKKVQKSSLDNSSDDDNTSSKKHEQSHYGSLEFETKNDDYFVERREDESFPNKLSRKNSRTRIMSDSSDDDRSKRSISKSPSFINEVKRECISDSDSMSINKIEEVADCDRSKKNSMLNLFGKSDGEDGKIKCDIESDYKTAAMKTIANDFSSENESVKSSRNSGEIRKKHKKKQKKYKPVYSDDDTKTENMDSNIQEGDYRYRNCDKYRRHSNKKEKRKDKLRDSVDNDDNRDDKNKFKKDRSSPNNNCLESVNETSASNAKKEGKMEDIFGPLSDESDREISLQLLPKPHSPSKENDSNGFKNDLLDVKNNTVDKIKDDIKRKKEKKRKEKRIFREDDNSLDVDAVSKAIEARLFAESITDDEIRLKDESLIDSKNDMLNSHMTDSSVMDDFMKHDKLKKEKEKRKKKKRNKDDRTCRKEFIFHSTDRLEKSEQNLSTTIQVSEIPSKILNDKDLSDEALNPKSDNKFDECASLNVSPSLPRLTDSPPTVSRSVFKEASSNCLDSFRESKLGDDPIITPNETEVHELEETTTTVSLNTNGNGLIGNTTKLSESGNKTENNESKEIVILSSSCADESEDAVRSICSLENDIDKGTEKTIEKNDSRLIEKKVDEKPRAVISQEETEDAVAALLGESFGGKSDTFSICYEQTDVVSTNHDVTVNVSVENENIPEEDAEEMRQAVQNLNASEMEIKPDTPVSDSDLLLIDTDTEELDESTQDAIERLPVNIIATNQSRNAHVSQSKTPEVTSIILSKPKPMVVQSATGEPRDTMKKPDVEAKVHLVKRDNIQAKTSTATPVITSWTLTNNKLLEPHLLNISSNAHPILDKNENKPQHVSANIVQLKSSQNHIVQVSNSIKPIVASARVGAPYRVLNQIIRPQVSNLQAPTIKIPEPHVLYQKPQGIVISPRISSDARLISPKMSPQGEPSTSPRMSNMAILNTSPQNLNSVGLTSPTSAIQQRSPGQVTVVRMQQPPLSPIQTVHLPHGARAMVSPNRANSVLVQAHRTPIHFNRLPVSPILAPINKQVSVNNIIQQNKNSINSNLMHTQKIVTTDTKKIEPKMSDNLNEPSKIILSPTSLQHSTNPTIMTQNRLISMQNTVHVGNINSKLHMNNKVLINAISQSNDKRENLTQKSEQVSNIPFCSTPLIHVAGINQSTASIIQSNTKPVVCGLQDPNSINRNHANVIQAISSQRLSTSSSLGNLLQIDTNKASPSVLSSPGSLRTSTVLTKLETNNPQTSIAVNSSPVTIKSTNIPDGFRVHSNPNSVQTSVPLRISLGRESDKYTIDKFEPNPLFSASNSPNKENNLKSDMSITKCETDFEELLKDNTNEIKVTNDPEKKLEVNVGKAVTLFQTNSQHLSKTVLDSDKKDIASKENNECDISGRKLSEHPTVLAVATVEKEGKEVSPTLSTLIAAIEPDSKVNPGLNQDLTNSMKSSIIKAHQTDKVNITLPNQFSPIQDSQIEVSKAGVLIPGTITDNHASLVTFCKTEEAHTEASEGTMNHIKNIDDSDAWTASDLNIESVIKKVDSLCNDNTDYMEHLEDKKNDKSTLSSDVTVDTVEKALEVIPTGKSTDNLDDVTMDSNTFQDIIGDKGFTVTKRGGRNIRGKKTDKTQDRVQTRQINKPQRGTGKRGRGRAKVDKKIKNLVKVNSNTLPGDVYDFHEDSGDESTTSPTKTETRPRLILTIKSPLSANANVTPTSTLSISQKEQNKIAEKLNKEEKAEDFVSPSPNTRKSRRLQEKDGQKSGTDEVIEDVTKGVGCQSKLNKDTNKKKPVKLVTTTAKPPQQEKTSTDTRKSPRGGKRVRDRSLSDASVDSGEEKNDRKEEGCTPAKVPRPQETTTAPGEEPDPPAPARIITTSATAFQPESHVSVVSAPSTATTQVLVGSPSLCPGPSAVPTPITKPPKKMISEISAKLGCVFEAQQQQATTADIQHGGEAAPARWAPDSVPSTLMPVGATEASDARVQSPALPHRPPSTPSAPSTPAAHRPADRATPILLRNGEGEGAGAVAGRGYRAYVGTASLPRGAHHPPPDPLHHHAKQVAVVPPHLRHHHPGNPSSRVSVTNVPSISPQGQIPVGERMYPHFSHQHYQMYQDHFHATQQQDIRTTASPFTRGLEAEGCEAPQPPLELRRPPSARVPRPAHSPAHHQPQDRLIMYGAMVSGGGGGGCPRSPPPAHGTSHPPRVPSALPSATAHGPPHASQVPREADSLQMLLQRYPVMWQGLLALKNDSAAVQMHFVGGNPGVAGDTLSRHADHSTPLLRIAQRMRLEPAQLDQVHRKMKMENEHCMLLALPCGRDHMDVLQQSTNLTAGFITYLQRKQAAGIVNIAPPGHQQAMFTVHIFPSCDFANENLNRIAPDLMHRVADIAHLLIVIATV